MVDKLAALAFLGTILGTVALASMLLSNANLGNKIEGVELALSKKETGMMQRITDLSTGLAQRIDSLNTETSSLKRRLESVGEEQAKLKTLQETMKTLQGDNVASHATITKLEKTLAETNLRVKSLEEEIAKIRAPDLLIETAKRERAPLIYMVAYPEFHTIIWPRFRESYPWAPAEPRYVEGSAGLRSRFISEFSANAPTADILWQPTPPLLVELGPVLDPFPEMKYRSLYDRTFTDGSTYGSETVLGVIIYNTNIVSATRAPRSWLELADTTWKGRIVMQDPRALTETASLLTDMIPVLGREWWEIFMKRLAANQPFFVENPSAVYEKVVNGEYPVGVGFAKDVLTQKQGNPVAIAWPSEPPIGVFRQSGLRIGISKKAASPSFAKIFVEWLMSPAGQKAVGETGRMPALNTANSPVAVSVIVPRGTKLFDTNPEFFAENQFWLEKIRSFFT